MRLRLKLKGTIVSKRATKVPIIRNWRIIWEMMEFGTKTDRVDLDISTNPIPDLYSNWSFEREIAPELTIKLGPIDGRTLGMWLTFQGREVHSESFTLPSVGTKKLFQVIKKPWAGVDVTIQGWTSLEA